MAAASFDVPNLLAVLQQTVEGISTAILPSFAGGRRAASLRQLFRPDGFFAYANDRQAQVSGCNLSAKLPSRESCLRLMHQHMKLAVKLLV